MALTHIPLTEEQKALPSGMVLPSGEGNYFDYSQHNIYNAGSGINFPFTQDTSGSGLIETHGPQGAAVEADSAFSSYGLATPYSNSQAAAVTQIDDFTIFNSYVHHYTTRPLDLGPDGSPVLGEFAIQIPYLSTYTVALKFDPYQL